jgi:hypothetical protein
VGDFAAFETHSGFDFVAIFKYFDGVLHLEIVIMLVNRRTKLDFFDFNNDLLFLGLVRAFLLLVQVFAKVNDFAHGRLSRRCDFNQIQAALTRNSQRFVRRHDADLAFLVNYTNFFGANAFVGANLRAALITTLWAAWATIAALIGSYSNNFTS